MQLECFTIIFYRYSYRSIVMYLRIPITTAFILRKKILFLWSFSEIISIQFSLFMNVIFDCGQWDQRLDIKMDIQFGLEENGQKKIHFLK